MAGTARKLIFTTGSPFARAVRIVLSEKQLAFERQETVWASPPDAMAKTTPTIQVPALIDGDRTLWDSNVILEYLMAVYPTPPAMADQPPFASEYIRSTHLWPDKLMHATLQTLGVSLAIVGQLTWSGVQHTENDFATRSATRVQILFDWFESQIPTPGEGFVPGVVSVQDVLLGVWCQYIERRPIGLTWRAAGRPRIEALVSRLEQRASFQREPALWWEPGVTWATAAEVAWAKEKTVSEGPTFAEWSGAQS